ncbi:hypothetical protein NVP2275O_129 [Vibrio phage 2.275.O._10N.286.54.E11]|nr:hypothetical protein NVP2275O_129 [Vibrio phage 2.275.O._10N.286.54.E11]
MNRMSMISKFSQVVTATRPQINATPLAERNDINVRKHTRERYRERFNRDGLTDEYINKHVTQMLVDSTICTSEQKRLIMNKCSHDIRNNYMYNDEYEQYSFGDIVFCVAFKEEMQNDVLVNVRHVITLYYL